MKTYSKLCYNPCDAKWLCYRINLSRSISRFDVRFRVSEKVLGYTLSTQPLGCKVFVPQAIAGKDARQAVEDVRSLCSSYLEVDGVFVHFRFPGRGQRDTPVVDMRGIV